MKNIIIIGAPGSGKGTYSAEIAQRYNMSHISTGDVLRAEIKKGTELGKSIQAIIEKGNLIPDETMVEILAKVYDEQPSGQGVIFDGFPRTVHQAEVLKEMFASRKQDMGIVVELSVDEQTLMERLLGRAIKEGRTDDNEETIKARFNVFYQQTRPVIEWFEKEGMRNTFTWKGSKDLMLSEIFDFLDKINTDK